MTGSSGTIGEGLIRTLRNRPHEVIGLDRKGGPFTDRVGTLTDRDFVPDRVRGVDASVHTAMRHQPHVATPVRQEVVDTPITGTLNLLEAAAATRVKAFLFRSTPSAFGRALTPARGAPAGVTAAVRPVPINRYGVTTVAAEDRCERCLHGDASCQETRHA